MPSSILDKKFVTTAIIIAIVYASIVIIINRIVGKEAAGVAGVALTALATAIFKQFESLRFQSISNIAPIQNNVTTPLQFSLWKIILIAFLFSGLTRLLIDLKDGIIPLLFHPVIPYLPDSQYINGKLINHGTIWEQSTKCIAYLLCGIIATKAFKTISFRIIIVAAMIGVILDFYNETLWYVFFGPNSFDFSIVEDYKYSFLWIIFSFVGSYLTQEKDKAAQKVPFFKRNKVILITLTLSVFVLLLMWLVPLILPNSAKEKVEFSNPFMKYEFLGESQVTKKNYKEAISFLDSARKLDSSNPATYYYKGFSYYELSNYDSAIEEINKALELNYDNQKKCYNVRANSYFFSNNYEAAIKDYDTLEKLNGTTAYSYYFRGLCYRELKNYSSAISDFSKACSLDSTDPEFYYNRGLCYYFQDHYDSGVSDLNKALTLNLTDKEIYSVRGQCFYELKDYTLSIEDFNKAIEFDSTNSTAYNLRGAAKVLSNLPGYCDDFLKSSDLNNSAGKENLQKYCMEKN